MELNRLPKVTIILVFQDHLTKHVMVYVTPNQTAKTVANFLYQGYISISGALARLLSDHGANFMSNIISEMCKLLGMKKLHTMPYHPQTNRLVDRSHQTIIQMIGKLEEDEKADWSGYLAKIVHAYSATWSTVMGYSPHYLMFGHRLRLPVNFCFPTLRSAEVSQSGTSIKHVDEYVATVQDHLKTNLQEVQAQSMTESQTEMVLWLENRCHRFEAWQSCLSQGGCLSREEEDHGQMGGQASWGGASDHKTFPCMKWRTSKEIHTS